MEQEDMYINRIIQGGIYFLTLPEDKKTRPYVVISKNFGYGMNVIIFSITSKCPTSEFMLPVVIRGKVSFIRTSGTREVAMKTIVESEFGGVVRPDILSLAISFYASRFMNVSEKDIARMHEEEKEYLHDIEERKYPLYMDESVIFTTSDFLSNKYCAESKPSLVYPIQEPGKNRSYSMDPTKMRVPRYLKDWSIRQLKEFRKDMYRYSNKELAKRYHCSISQVQFIRSRVKDELAKRMGGDVTI